MNDIKSRKRIIMITEKHNLKSTIDIGIRLNEQTLFFDIETTGFSPTSSHLYMIGCCYLSNIGFETIQWFDEAKTNDGELQVLQSFSVFARKFSSCISFNGMTFDFPYLRKKFAHYHMDDPLNHLIHIDIYKKIKPFKTFFNLPDFKQKSLETFLNLQREDIFSGGELIPIYYKYVKTKDNQCLHWLMQHNYDDLCGMINLLPIMSYFDFFEGHFEITKTDIIDNDLALEIKLYTRIPVPLQTPGTLIDIELSESSGRLRIHGFNGTLKYFYDNIKDYYYLPIEDMAIHKSIASFVDKAYRQKATKENCYIKKSGFFLPQLQILFTPDYRETATSRIYYFEWDSTSHDLNTLHKYVLSLLPYSK